MKRILIWPPIDAHSIIPALHTVRYIRCTQYCSCREGYILGEKAVQTSRWRRSTPLDALRPMFAAMQTRQASRQWDCHSRTPFAPPRGTQTSLRCRPQDGRGTGAGMCTWSRLSRNLHYGFRHRLLQFGQNDCTCNSNPLQRAGKPLERANTDESSSRQDGRGTRAGTRLMPWPSAAAGTRTIQHEASVAANSCGRERQEACQYDKRGDSPKAYRLHWELELCASAMWCCRHTTTNVN